jgi:hypothetical protein
LVVELIKRQETRRGETRAEYAFDRSSICHFRKHAIKRQPGFCGHLAVVGGCAGRWQWVCMRMVRTRCFAMATWLCGLRAMSGRKEKKKNRASSKPKRPKNPYFPSWCLQYNTKSSQFTAASSNSNSYKPVGTKPVLWAGAGAFF